MRKRLAASVLLMLAVWALPVMAQANEKVENIDYEYIGDLLDRQYVLKDGQLVPKVKPVTDYTPVNSSTVVWEDGYYVVSGNVTIGERITVKGIVNLILKDKATLTAEKGITVHTGNLLTIYAQSEVEDTMGRIVIGGSRQNRAGIGGTGQGTSGTRSCGFVTINGGKIDFSSQTESDVQGTSAAGIGGSTNGGCGKITINGGVIDGIKSNDGACIGNGGAGSGGIIIINGGTIRNLASQYGACIGGGGGNQSTAPSITINGGTISNIASKGGAAIGGGYLISSRDITINGGSITIVEGDYDSVSGAGIGGGFDGQGGNSEKRITINGGRITILPSDGGESKRTGAAIGGGEGAGSYAITISGGEIYAKTAAVAAIGSTTNTQPYVFIRPAEGEKIEVQYGNTVESHYENQNVSAWKESNVTVKTLDNGFSPVSIDTAPQTKTMIDTALSFEVESIPEGLGDFTVKYKTGEQEYSGTLPTDLGTYDVLVSRKQTISRNADNSVNLENSYKRFECEIPGGLTIVRADRSAPEQGKDFTVGDETYMGFGDGWLKPAGTDALEYRPKDAADFAALDSCAEGLAPGAYVVRFAETGTYNASEVATVNILASTQKTDVQLVKEAIEALPDSVEPDDVDTVTAIRNAQKLFLALGEQERGKIEPQLVEKLNALIAAAFRYVIVEGDGASVMAASKTALRFVANGPAKWLQAVKVDGSALAQSRYTVESGSTIVTLHDDYVASLPAGEHTLTLVYNDGSVSAQFSVLAELNLPQTGDNSGLAQWAALALLCAGGVIALLTRRKRA